MINLLSPILEVLQTAQYHHEKHGIVVTAKDYMNGKYITYPVDVNATDCTKNSAVIPSNPLRSLSYYEAATGKVEVQRRNESDIFKTLLNYVYWCDPKKVSTDSNLGSKIAALEWKRHSKIAVDALTARIDSIKCISIETDPLKVFQKYNYRNEKFMFDNPPYECFSILMEVTFVAKCNPITFDPVC